MVFGRKSKVQIDLGDLISEKERLTEFLKASLKVSLSSVQNRLVVEDERVSLQELQHVVTKFIYKRNFNATHYVAVEGNTVKISMFKGAEKKKEKSRKEPAHQTAAQSWGL